ncbi:MFS transporter [Nocardia salmonicida]|uniref:MFS transporter n=1 Tax=Nocardia salmonicida TaxID=53431 RepID=A0ABZ1N345_9NOCA
MPQQPEAARISKRAGAAGFLGTLIEYFEFGSYGLLLIVIAPQFFPGDNEATSVLSGLLVFATGYVVRPLGGIFFGWLGDRKGRKVALIATVVPMGAASVVLGLLPTYATIGLAAPVLLVVVRLVQGFSAGGEIIGASTYVAESAPKLRRGFYAALTPMGSVTGGGLAGVVAGVIALSTTAEQMAAWGWRIPFLLCLPLMLVTLWVRAGLEDSPEFKDMVEKSEITKAPFLTAVRAMPDNIARVAVFSLVTNLIGAVGSTYMVIHLISDIGMKQAEVFMLMGLMQAVTFGGMLLSGRLSDRIGKPRMLSIGFTVSLIVAVPVFWLIDMSPDIWVLAVLIAVWQFAVGLQSPPLFGIFTEMFPRHIRYSAVAFGFNIGVIFGFGLTPYASQLLVKTTDNSFAPAYLAAVASAVGLVALYFSRGSIGNYLNSADRDMVDVPTVRTVEMD